MTEQVGRVLGGRYRLLAPVGRGASAQVFLAADVRLERQVAVKVLHDALADDQVFLRRFQAEAQAAAALNHPNIMAVYDWGHDDDVPWIVTEYLGGGSLRRLLDRGHRLSPSQALVVGLQAARGLDYAHRRGLVHRDIKPANLLFGDEGRLRIADFGLARALAEAAWTEPQGAVVGTARYASPEQAQGLSVTGRADVYSLALVLVEAVTGEVPFAADTTIGTLMARVDAPLCAPDELGPLAGPVEAAGAPEPDDRPDGRGLAVALTEVSPSLPRPAALPLAGAIDVDITDDHDPTEHAAGASDGPEVPSFVSAGGEPSPTTAPADATVTWRGPDAEDDDLTVIDPRPVAGSRVVVDVDADGDGHDVAGDDGDDGPFDGAGEDGWTDDGWDPRSPDGRRRRWPRILLVVLLVGLVGAAVALLVRGLTDGPSVAIVPAVAGLDEDSAVDSLRDLGWEVTVERVREDGTEAGDALRTEPERGTELADGEAITLIVSEGQTLVEVPDIVRGTPRADAEAALVDLELVPVVIEVFDEEVPAGAVVEPPAGAGSEVERDSDVELVVSKGPEPRVIPDDLAGLGSGEAQERLTVLGLVPVVVEEFSDDVDAGVVIGTDPGPGAEAARDSEVRVVVSKGPELVAVPDVTGAATPAEAAAILEDAGLVSGDVSGPAAGSPAGTSPGAGEMVTKGTVVDIILG